VRLIVLPCVTYLTKSNHMAAGFMAVLFENN